MKRFYIENYILLYQLPSAEVKNEWGYISSPSYVFTVWYLAKHRDNFTFPISSAGCWYK